MSWDHRRKLLLLLSLPLSSSSSSSSAAAAARRHHRHLLRPIPPSWVSPPHSSPFLHESRVSGRFSFSSSAADSVGAGGGRRLSKCWNCGTASGSPAPFLACGTCGSVQPVDASVDYFQIFGLKRAYEVKGDNLEGKYKDWQKKLHPDLVHTKSEDEKAFAAEQSARVIDAYRTLINPLSRALYLLRLEGVQVDEEKTISDPELLVEMMEIREAVDEADDSQALERIKSQVQGKLETWSNSFKQAFEKQDLDTAVASTQRMRYYERAMEEIVKKL
ncbi:uncharacterized protein LOC109708505 [Ananas comosus]|uniref:Iron-sulfur cluster co-chaperone protein HscB, mitochondrial n=1 Tax=Ananas comosus TaxID=4615 RepID=A0A199VVX8_ANACO|nr:uncharacterized protein LOC109704139 [Ananas comosus]XP_020085866.1 uncharacterized protein LOC109708505 [Ananas comosus]OAY81397.1 Iron-sulfur cluster co-chaperone protein HscB, mitochondrial [Ananas comosus]